MAKKKKTTTTSVVHDTTRDFVTHTRTPYEMISENIAWMDWEKVQKVMEFLDWTWDNNKCSPSQEELKDKAYELLDGAMIEALEFIKEKDTTNFNRTVSHSSGGLNAEVFIEEGELYGTNISFVVENWPTDRFTMETSRYNELLNQ
jgi:hypothetical protein